MLLMSKKSRLSPAYDDSTKKIECIGTRWRNLLAEMTMRRDRYMHHADTISKFLLIDIS